MDGLWVVCDVCGCLVADHDLHETWHHFFEPGQTHDAAVSAESGE